jgi:precorrin-2 dehydrogenase/sirohydrochlorin ferrochelatase
MEDTLYPIFLKLTGKTVAVIGGGKIAERKVLSFIGTGARIEVTSPELTDELFRLAEAGKIVWKNKLFDAGDLANAFLVIAASNDRATNQLVKASAENGQLVCLADDKENSDFQIPSVVRRGKLALAISTSGASPMLAKAIRTKLEQDFDERFADYLDFLDKARKMILKTVDDPARKKQLLAAIIRRKFFESNNRYEDFLQLLNEYDQNQ